MKSDLDIARYNTSKKLSQLNKVIQYLSYHLEERIFQVSYLKQKYEEQEMEIVNGIDDKIRPIFENLNESRIEIEEQTNRFYQNKLSTIRAALDARFKKAVNDVELKMKEVQDEIGKSITTIEIINTTLDEQISILKDRSKFDVSSNKIKVTQIGKDHQLEMKKFTGESKRKIKSIEEEFQKKAQELEQQHKKNIEQLKTKSTQKTPTLPPNFKQTFFNYKERIKVLKNLIYDDLTEVNKQKRVYQQFINSFKDRLKKILEDFPKEINLDTEEIQKVRDENEGNYYKMNKRIKDLRAELDKRKQIYQNEIKNLEDQIKNKRGDLTKEHQEKEKMVQLTSKKSNNELFTFIQSLNEEKSKLKSKNEKEEKLIEQKIQKIRMEIDNFDDDHSIEFVTLREQKRSQVDEFKEEIVNFKSSFENKISNNIKKYNDLKKQYEEKIKHMSSQSIEFSKRDDEYKKLKIMLETINRSNESKMKFLSNSINDEISKFENEKNKEFNDFQNKLNLNFEVAEHKKKADISDYQKEIDIEFNRKQIENDTKYKKNIDQIKTEKVSQNDQELSELNSEYEKKFNLVENELNSIVVPEEIIELTDQSIHNLQEKLEKMPGEVIEERNSINQKYEQSIEEEEDRHRQLLLSYLAYCNEVQERDYESFQKEQKERINLLEKTINELNEELKSVEKMSPSLNKFNDLVDVEQVKLEEELSKVRQEMKEKIKKEEMIKQEMIKEANDKILQQEEENKNQYRLEKDKERGDSNEIHQLFELYRSKRKKLAENSGQILIDEEKNFNDLISKTKSDHSNNLVELKRAIINARHRKEDEDEFFEEKLLKEKRRLEKENKKLSEKFPKQLKLLRDGVSGRYPELDDLINEVTKRRDDAKAAVLNKPMRKEESNIIKRLEGQLSVVTSQLTSWGKELFQYRQQLIHQEGEYNVRFGVDRSVAVMKPAKKRPTTTLASKRLPKLCNVDYTQNLY